jgi:hypothetical protein
MRGVAPLPAASRARQYFPTRAYFSVTTMWQRTTKSIITAKHSFWRFMFKLASIQSIPEAYYWQKCTIRNHSQLRLGRFSSARRKGLRGKKNYNKSQ